MNDIKVLVWIFPILFIFHDFEEIIMMQPWIKKNRAYLSDRFPKLAGKLLPHFDSITTASFALGVFEEFILISLVSVVSFVSGSYGFWAGLFIAFTVHLIIHCFQALAVRKYIPALITSLLCLPACYYILKHAIPIFTASELIYNSLFGLLLMVLNLYAVHKGMTIFDKWQARYEK